MTKLSARMRLTLTIVLVCAVVLGAIGFAFAAVASMRTVNTVDSLDVIHSGTNSSLSPDASPAPLPTPTQTISATSKTGSPTYDASIVPGSEGSPVVFSSMLSSLSTDDSPSSHKGYVRDYFRAWVDANGNGCDTRAEVLMLESLTKVTHSSGCTVSAGSWVSPYDGVSVTTASKLDIDHFVPLSEAWKSGAYAWDSQTRVSYGNDLGYSLSLVAVTASSNRSKSDKDPSQWMPAVRSYYCDYASTWVAVKWRWSLTVDTLERRSLQSVLDGCSSTTVTVPNRATVAFLSADQIAAQQSGANSGSGAADNGGIDPNYGTCSNAKANGAGPYYQGTDTEYSWYRDADKDGIVCE